MSRMSKIVSVFLVASFILSGCASIVGKDSFPVSFQSNPEGANITIKDEKGRTMFSGRTPTMVTLSAGESYFHAKSYTVTFSKDGYDQQQITVKSTISGWYFGNIVFGGLIGLLIVDPITGKMWKLPETAIFGNLSSGSASNEEDRSLKIVTLDQVPVDLREQMVAVK